MFKVGDEVVCVDAEFHGYGSHSDALQLVLDGRNSTTANMAAGHLGTLVAQFNATRTASSSVSAVGVETRAWFNPNLESRWNIVPALIASLSMLQTLLLAALSVAREREQGTFDQLLVTPMRPMEILIGKALPSIAVGLIQASLIFAVALWWFQIPFSGSALLLYAALATFATACVGIGLSISALSLNMQQAMVYAFVLIMPLMLLSGLVTPVSNMPWSLQMLTYADPLRFAIELVRRVYLEGAGWSDVYTEFWPMVAVALVTLPVAATGVTLELSNLFTNDDAGTFCESGLIRLLDASSQVVGEKFFFADSATGTKVVSLDSASGFTSIEVVAAPTTAVATSCMAATARTPVASAVRSSRTPAASCTAATSC